MNAPLPPPPPPPPPGATADGQSNSTNNAGATDSGILDTGTNPDGSPKYGTNPDGTPRYGTSEDGLIMELGPDGKPVIGPDGKPVYKKSDGSGLEFELGPDGKPVIGPDGKPVYKKGDETSDGSGIGVELGPDGKPVKKGAATRRPGAPPPPPPPPPRAPGAPPSVDIRAFNPTTNDKEEQKRLRSNMLVLDAAGGGGAGDESKDANDALNRSDPNKAFASNVLKATAADKTTATRLSNLGTTIAQGKIIDGVLETAINTDLPGTLRAVVSRDVFAESGREIMIPKGSRLIGTYNTAVFRGQRRVFIVWTRLIRPDGLDIEIGSPGIDQLGRGGVEGMVDNKYSEIFSAAALTSVFDIGVAVIANTLIDDQGTTTTTNGNGTTTSGTVASTSAAAAISNLGNTSKDIVNSFLDLRPTITVDQGTRVNVFVNQDLIFPSALLNGPFIQ
jgi:type IV secretion system protein VirB10